MSLRFARSHGASEGESPRGLGKPAALALMVAAMTWLAPDAAMAASMDPALERLVMNPGCRTEFGAIEPAAAPCIPDQAAFVRLVSQYGFAFAPTALHPARTTGIAGFQVSFEGSFASINSGSDDWRRGTRGALDSSRDLASVRNDDPAPILQLYSVRLRKGLGFGLEVGGQFGFMPQTSFLTAGGDLRWALLEGFRDGVLGRVPDVSVGGGVRTTTGSPQMQITVFSADARVSKPFVVHDEATITPWLGFQHLWILGKSGVIDLTPATDAMGYCNPQGTAAGSSGQPSCDAGSPLDFQNNVVFESVQLHRPRLLVGTNYQYELLSLSAQIMLDWLAPASAQRNDSHRAALASEPRQWGFALDAGVRF